MVAGLQHGLEGIDDRRPHGHRPHVDIVVDRGRQIGAGEQAALLAHLDGDGPRANAAENLPRKRIGHRTRRRRIEHQRGRVRGCKPVVEPVHAEVGDRGNVDQDFSDHDQRDRQQQELSGQAEPTTQRQPRCLDPELFDRL
jgi:hypothetical protein